MLVCRLPHPAAKDARTREVAHYWPESPWSSFLLAGGVAPPLGRRNSAIIESCLGSVIFDLHKSALNEEYRENGNIRLTISVFYLAKYRLRVRGRFKKPTGCEHKANVGRC